jgi:sugar-specific transcriptional regulator TrmB
MAVSRNGFSLDDNEIRILVDLGLNLSQAKVYFALLNIGCSNARTVAKFSKVVRQDIYRILNELIELGLVAKTLDTPTKFDPVPLEKGLNILFNNRSKNMSEMHRKASMLLKKFQGKQTYTNSTEDSRFELLTFNEKSEIAGTEVIDAAEINIKSITPWEFLRSILPIHFERYKKALKRGVKIQTLTDKPECESLPKQYEALVTNPLFEIICVPQLVTSFVIVDDKIVFIGAGTKHYGFGRSLISNDPPIVTLVREYFEMMYHKNVGAPSQKPTL